MAKKAQKFPKEILVTQDEQEDATYLVAREEIADLDSEQDADREVAVYVLKEIRRFAVTRDLVK